MTMATMSRFFALLALMANVGSVTVVAALPWRRVALVDAIRRHALWLATTVAAVATAGSLYYGEWVGLEPCRLCWYQRIAMYPLVIVLGVAAWRGDRAIARGIGWPLAAIGGSISLWHYAQQLSPDLAGDTCSATAPCTAAYVWEFGFVSIPYMALSGFLAIALLLAVAGATAPTPDPTPSTSQGGRS